MAHKLGVRTTFWAYTYKDYDPNNQLDHYTALQNLKGGLHPGCVYLLHAVSSTNAAVLGDLIDWIRAQGYEILPLCDIDISEAKAQNNG
jgi:peptidoglycan-N-acetylmuramic acid deacetylase